MKGSGAQHDEALGGSLQQEPETCEPELHPACPTGCKGFSSAAAPGAQQDATSVAAFAATGAD
ncbi:hypothetical protein N1030_00105 [Desulfovibrio mangrovi]|uniref:hypothetical protein n=1 Tax=Desulfovibrio mangrovi TaxID=2976983 RepID=UPI00224675E7|nr:hypothetical protein [Desulfovibrio mangrovi]UZP69216.1 hypothetical protein N1030_00105 [Desulfovibrio mangrovi]